MTLMPAATDGWQLRPRWRDDLGFQPRLELGEHGTWIHAGNEPQVPVEPGLARENVGSGAAAHPIDRDRRVRRLEAIVVMRLGQLALDLLE